MRPKITAFVRPIRSEPDNPCACDALAAAEQAYSPALLNHCLRCWLWGDLFARLGDISYDDEILYLVSCARNSFT